MLRRDHPQPKFYKILDRWYEVTGDARGMSAKSYEVLDKESRTIVGSIARVRKSGSIWYANGVHHTQDLKDACEDLIRNGARLEATT